MRMMMSSTTTMTATFSSADSPRSVLGTTAGSVLLELGAGVLRPGGSGEEVPLVDCTTGLVPFVTTVELLPATAEVYVCEGSFVVLGFGNNDTPCGMVELAVPGELIGVVLRVSLGAEEFLRADVKVLWCPCEGVGLNGNGVAELEVLLMVEPCGGGVVFAYSVDGLFHPHMVEDLYGLVDGRGDVDGGSRGPFSVTATHDGGRIYMNYHCISA